MSDSIIKIDAQKVYDSGNKIISESKELLRNLETAAKAVRETEGCFQSDSGNEFRGKIRNANAKFDEFKTNVEEYGKFLQKYAEHHKESVRKEKKVIGDGLKQF